MTKNKDVKEWIIIFKKILKGTGIVFLVFIVGIIIFAFLGKSDTLNLEVGSVELNSISDGTYEGSYNSYRWSNNVQVTVEGNQISRIKVLKGPTGRDKIQQELIERILSSQSLAVDVVTGATADSKAFLKAVENALTK